MNLPRILSRGPGLLWALAAAMLSSCSDTAGPFMPLVPDAAERTTAPSAVPVEPQRVRWRLKLPGDYSLHSPGVGGDGTIYVSLPNGKLVAVASDGTQRWVFQAGFGGGVYGPVSVGPDGTIYVAGLVPNPNGGGSVGGIFAVTPAGAQRWLFNQTGMSIVAGPNVGPDGNVYAVDEAPGIGFFSLTPLGQLRFRTGAFSEYGPLGQEIAFGTGQAYFAFDMVGLGGGSRLFAYSLNGSAVFQAAGTANNSQADVGPNGNAVIETFPIGIGLSLTAFTPSGGTAWSFYQWPGNTEEHPDVGPDNTAYTVRNLSTLFAINASGAERWRYVDSGIMFQPVVAPGNAQLFMGGRITYGQPGFFLSVGTDGTPRWRVVLPDEPGFAPYGQLVPMTRPVFSPDGTTAYAVADVAGDGSGPNVYSFLYAIDISGAPPPANSPPVATLAATSPTTIRPGGSVAFQATFSDPDAGDAPWRYRWVFGNGQVNGSSTTPGAIAATRVYATAGVYRVAFGVMDARGAVDTTNVVRVMVR